MRCTSCGFANPEGSKFCIECGTPLPNRCPRCGHDNLPRAKFCGECGASFTTEVQTPKSQAHNLEPQPISTERASSAGERRQLTVMFCDLVGSTALSEQLDPEELREVVRAYQETCAKVIKRFEGHIAQYLGDGLLVYFGYPHAHEDDAQRAVQVGLEIIAALQKLVPSPWKGEGQGEGELQLHTYGQPPHPSPLPFGERGLTTKPLQVRIGIHTGLVVVGEIGGGGRHEQLALGETPNIAARVQGKAAPDTVVISAATYRLVQGLFECQDLGSHTLHGVSTSLSLYRVAGESAAQSRFEAAVQHGLTPLVGREHEVGLLIERWERAKQAEGQVVLLSGEPGIGKSRLVQVMRERIEREGVLRLEFRCSPYHQNSAWYPVVEHVQRVLQFRRDDIPSTKLEKLQKTLARYRFPQADTVPLLAALLSLPRPDGYPSLSLSSQRQKQKTQEALVAWLLEEAERQAVYCPWEDLHWADPSTLELLNLLIEQAPTARLYLLLTFRPEFMPPWSPRSHISQLTLSRLGRNQVTQMVEKVAGDKTLPAEVMQQIVVKTDGVPLFVEELTKTVAESVGATGRSPLSLAIPATLQDSLMARLDRLNTAKEVAQLGATLGREFSYELLQAVSPFDEATLQRGLSQLVETELVYQRGLPPQTRYLFKHALIQDAAYQSLLKSKRQQYHKQIVQVLEERFPETKETQPELLAHHYTEASLIAQAIPYWQQAGERAVERSANVEAIGPLTRGLELLKTLPVTPERTQQELTLQITLGVPLIHIKGYAAPEVERTYTRARGLCQQVGETPQLFSALWGLWLFYVCAGGHETARELGEQLLSLAQRVHDPAPVAHYALGCSLFLLGELAQGREHLEQGIALYHPQSHRSYAFLYSQDPRVVCSSYAAWSPWCLGYPDQALKRNTDMLTFAQELAHPFSLAFALNFAAALYQFRGEGQAAQERADAAIALCAEQGFPFWLAMGTILQGWVLAEQGQAEKGIAQIRHGLTSYRATGAELFRPHFLALLAEACGKGGRTEEGLTALAEALAMVHQNGERYYEAELYRLKGELSLQSGVRSLQSEITSPQLPIPNPRAEAEACFLKAIEIAQRQQAKSLELRAVMSLSRLWQQQGRKDEARQMLAEIYGWFTEGFDTADLKEAKVLLEGLAR